MNGLQITADYKKIFIQTYNSIEQREYLMKSNKWINQQSNIVRWELHAKTMNKLNQGHRHIVQKYIRNKLPSNIRQNKYHQYKIPPCKVCNTEIELVRHILTCKACKECNTIQKNYQT